MPYWLKLQGTARPRSAWVPNEWWGHHLRGDEVVQFESGPAKGQGPIGSGDGVILAASGWGRIFAAVTVTDDPEWAREPRWGPRWPWVVRGRLVAFVDRVEQGPKIVEAGVPRSYGRSYQRITAEEYQAGIDALLASGGRSAH